MRVERRLTGHVPFQRAPAQSRGAPHGRPWAGRRERRLARGVGTALVAAALTACGRGQTTPPLTVPASATGTSQQVEALARQALTLDAAGDRGADTLYASDALVVANARIRVAAPRFAAVTPGGRVTIAAATVTLQGRFAWVMVDYRWFNLEQRLAEVGRVTFVCEQRPAGWRIVHAHSSQPLPWER